MTQNNDNLYYEKTLDSSLIYEGKILNLEILTVELPNGAAAKREIVRHNGACAVLAIKDDKFVMVKQFRKSLETELLEIPAGKIEKNEDPHLCAMRELQEETGYTAEKFDFFMDMYVAAGYSSEIIHIYIAENLTYTAESPDEDEFVSTIEIDFKDAYRMVMNNEIKDSKTLCALLKFFNEREIITTVKTKLL